MALTETWTAAASPHVIPSAISISAPLTIEPCAVVRIGPDVTVTVTGNGSLVANGAADHPVTIERQDSGKAWAQLRAIAGGTLRLSYTNVIGGGAKLNAVLDGASAIEVRGADQTQPPGEQLHVDHVLIKDSASQGVLLREAGAFSSTSTDLTIEGAAHAPVHTWASAAGTLPSGKYTGNGRDEITLEGTGLASIGLDTTLHARGVPYRIGDSLSEGRLDVAARTSGQVAVLTIEAGVTMRFKSGGAVFVQYAQNTLPATGALVAVGTATAPIVFASAQDTPAAGDWLGIHFNGRVDSRTRLDHVRVEHAGGTTTFQGSSCRYPDNINNAAAIRVFVEPASSFISNTTVVASGRHGVDRGWLGPSTVSFVANNDLAGAATCKETYPAPNMGVCPAPVPCP